MMNEIPIAAAHETYRADHPDEFVGTQWLSIKEAAGHLGITPRAIRKRIAKGQWPWGHAELRMIPTQPQAVWFVTESSLRH